MSEVPLYLFPEVHDAASERVFVRVLYIYIYVHVHTGVHIYTYTCTQVTYRLWGSHNLFPEVYDTASEGVFVLVQRRENQGGLTWPTILKLTGWFRGTDPSTSA